MRTHQLRRGIVAMAMAMGGFISLAQAQSPFALDLRICPFIEVLPDPFEPPIIRFPVGCEIVDCCPGCPGPGPLDVRIRFSAPEGALVRLNVQGTSPEVQKSLKLGGNAKWADGALLLAPGESSIQGWSSDSKEVPVITPKISFPKGALNKFASADAASSADKQPDEPVVFRVTQYRGDYLVREFGLRYHIRLCPRLPRSDIIRLTNNTSGDQALSLLDARRVGGCVNDEPERGTPIIDKGSVLSNGACRSEAGIFSLDNAVAFRENVTNWTDALGDVLPMPLSPLVRERATYWVIHGPFAATQARVNADIARANQLYNQQEGGIRVATTAINDSTADPDAPGLLDSDCGDEVALRTNIGFTAGQLNVYYNETSGARGWWCGDDTIIVSASADNESLAHEFGHGFSLGHSNTVPGIPTSNVMRTGGTGRTTFSTGQMFRTSINTGSRINGHGLRPGGVTRNCPDATTSDACPDLALDPP